MSNRNNSSWGLFLFIDSVLGLEAVRPGQSKHRQEIICDNVQLGYQLRLQSFMLKGYHQIKFKPKVVGCVFQLRIYTYIWERERKKRRLLETFPILKSKKKNCIGNDAISPRTVQILLPAVLGACSQPSLTLRACSFCFQHPLFKGSGGWSNSSPGARGEMPSSPTVISRAGMGIWRLGKCITNQACGTQAQTPMKPSRS